MANHSERIYRQLYEKYYIMMDKTKKIYERYGYAIAVISIIIATALFYPGRDYFAKGQWAMLYLLIIAAIAGVSGTGPAILASFAAFLAWNYFFLPPFHQFIIYDYKDWLALFVFLAVGILMGIQTGKIKERQTQIAAKEREIAQANALIETDKMKSTFISSVSHELKTPLASIAATITNLTDKDIKWDKNKVRDELECLKEDVKRLNSSISSLIDLAMLESSSWKPQKGSYELGEILAAVVSKIPAGAGTRIKFSIPDGLPLINVDFGQYTRAIQNVVENALLYSDSDSEVTVSACTGEGEIKIFIRDNGPGIADNEKKHIFDKFYRGASSAKVPHGTGLGLAITQEIVRFHGGKIWVQDAAGRGARFVITLPVKGEHDD